MDRSGSMSYHNSNKPKKTKMPRPHHRSSSASRSSTPSPSSSHPLLLRSTVIRPRPLSSSCSATAPRISLSCASVTRSRSWPDRASVMSRVSTSVARAALTSRMRPRRSAASGVRIWARREARASASASLGGQGVRGWTDAGRVEAYFWSSGEGPEPEGPPEEVCCCFSWARRALRICGAGLAGPRGRRWGGSVLLRDQRRTF
jgi:hypothetical protein